MDDDLVAVMERCPYCTRFRWEHDDLKWRRHQALYRGSWRAVAGSATPTPKTGDHPLTDQPGAVESPPLR